MTADIDIPSVWSYGYEWADYYPYMGVIEKAMIRRNIFYLLVLVLILPLFCCKNNPTQPEDVLQYRDRAIVSYTREIVVCPDAPSGELLIHYRLFDPYAEEPIMSENTQEQIDGDFRVGSIHPTLIVQNVYIGVLKNVLVHTRSDQPEHMVYVQDPKLHCSDAKRWKTIQGIAIQGAHSLKNRSNRLYFKMSKY